MLTNLVGGLNPYGTQDEISLLFGKIKNEKDLKKQMIDNIIKFLQELGPGFSLVGKEYKLTTPTNETFYIDLLLYHTKIQLIL